jgi:hypothetical protein
MHTSQTVNIAPNMRNLTDPHMELSEVAAACRELIDSGLLSDRHADAIQILMWRAHMARAVISEADGYFFDGDTLNGRKELARAYNLLAR